MKMDASDFQALLAEIREFWCHLLARCQGTEKSNREELPHAQSDLTLAR